MTGESIAFDPAADYYDRTRALPAAARAEVVARLKANLAADGLNLEIGVGTGRIALPLHTEKVAVLGIDLSEPMLRRLIANAGHRLPFPLARADATQLPFRDGRLDSVLACHVLHLIPNWARCVAEIRRVLRPGGVFLLDLGGGPGGRWRMVFDRVAAAAGRPVPRVGLADLDALRPVADELGFLPPVALDPVAIRVHRPLSDALAELSRRIHAWTWTVEQAVMDRAVAEAREWAESELGDISVPEPVESVSQWLAFAVPAAAHE